MVGRTYIVGYKMNLFKVEHYKNIAIHMHNPGQSYSYNYEVQVIKKNRTAKLIPRNF